MVVRSIDLASRRHVFFPWLLFLFLFFKKSEFFLNFEWAKKNGPQQQWSASVLPPTMTLVALESAPVHWGSGFFWLRWVEIWMVIVILKMKFSRKCLAKDPLYFGKVEKFAQKWLKFTIHDNFHGQFGKTVISIFSCTYKHKCLQLVNASLVV